MPLMPAGVLAIGDSGGATVYGALPSCWRSRQTAFWVFDGGSGSMVKVIDTLARIGTIADVQ